MTEPSPASDPYAYMGIIKNQDGSITRYPTRLPCAPATPDPSPQNPVVSKDITVTVSHSNSTWMRLYVPTSALVSSHKLPLVVYYHGGGFVICSVDIKLFNDFCNLMALELNVVVASPSYRLAPEHRLPAAYHDGVDALMRFIRTSDDEWIKSNADLSNVYLMGSNAGGNLAYNAGHRVGNLLAPLRIRGLILHHPFFGGEERCESELRHVDDEAFPLAAVLDACWELCLPVGANRDHEYSNPTVGDGPDNMEKIGLLGWKVMVSGGGVDSMIDTQRDVAKLMKEKGVDVVERFNDGNVLSAELGDHSKAQTLLASIRNFIYSCAP